VTKVKTIGDAVVIVSNLEKFQDDHASRTVRLGLDLIKSVEEFNKMNAFGVNLAIRVGIHTGSLYAGVMRTKKFAFDVWGEALYLADLCQARSLPNTIAITESTFKLVKDKFNLTLGQTICFKEQQVQSYLIETANSCVGQ